MKKIIILSLLLTACNMGVNPTQYDAAVKFCAPHGGLRWVGGTSLEGDTPGRFVLCKCNDGTRVEGYAPSPAIVMSAVK